MIAQGEVRWADLPEPTGSGPGYRRPVVVVQADNLNRSRLATVVCIPLTSNLKWTDAPGNVLLAAQDTGLSKDSVGNVSQIVSLDKRAPHGMCGKGPAIQAQAAVGRNRPYSRQMIPWSDNRPMSEHVIRATYSGRTIRVYQAYRPEIAFPALKAGRFVPPFSMGRMTWIKPSFYWMMYRCGYATKPGQEVVLGIDITREGFEWALANAALSSFTPGVHASHEEWKNLVAEKPVRIQWDPEKDWRLRPIPGVRAIQIGLSRQAVERYVNEWTVRIEDVTPLARLASAAAEAGDGPPTLPGVDERPYPHLISNNA